MKYKNILLIDDDVDDQDIFKTAVGDITDDVNCIALTSGAEALLKLEAKLIIPDVIFLDLNMPVMSGQQFLVEIKASERLMQIPVIIFSTSSYPATITMMKNLGAHDFITKPNKFDKLVEILTPFLS